MSGVIHKAGLFALLHFLLIQGKPDAWMGWLLLAFSATSAVIGGLYTVGQRDLKRLLGYSSTENVGIAGIGFGVGMLGRRGTCRAWWRWVTPGACCMCSTMRFSNASCFMQRAASIRPNTAWTWSAWAALAKLMPLTGVSFLVGGVAISALPPFNGFASEFLIYSGLFTGGCLGCLGQAAAGWRGHAAGVCRRGVCPVDHPRLWRDLYGPVARRHAATRCRAQPLDAGPLLIHTAGTALLGLLPVLGSGDGGGTDTAVFAGHEPCRCGAGGRSHGQFARGVAARRIHFADGATGVMPCCGWLTGCVQRSQPPVVPPGAAATPQVAPLQYTGSSFSKDFAH
jgi:hydrogenase-4 component B